MGIDPRASVPSDLHRIRTSTSTASASQYSTWAFSAGEDVASTSGKDWFWLFSCRSSASFRAFSATRTDPATTADASRLFASSDPNTLLSSPSAAEDLHPQMLRAFLENEELISVTPLD